MMLLVAMLGLAERIPPDETEQPKRDYPADSGKPLSGPLTSVRPTRLAASFEVRDSHPLPTTTETSQTLVPPLLPNPLYKLFVSFLCGQLNTSSSALLPSNSTDAASNITLDRGLYRVGWESDDLTECLGL